MSQGRIKTKKLIPQLGVLKSSYLVVLTLVTAIVCLAEVLSNVCKHGIDRVEVGKVDIYIWESEGQFLVQSHDKIDKQQ